MDEVAPLDKAEVAPLDGLLDGCKILDDGCDNLMHPIIRRWHSPSDGM